MGMGAASKCNPSDAPAVGALGGPNGFGPCGDAAHGVYNRSRMTLRTSAAAAVLALAAAPARATGPYLGASLALAEMPILYDAALYMAGPGVELGFTVGDRAAVGAQLFLVGAPGYAALMGAILEARFMVWPVGYDNEPYAAVGVGAAQGQLGNVQLIALLVKLAAGTRQYLAGRTMYLAAEVSLVNLISIGFTLSVGFQL